MSGWSEGKMTLKESSPPTASATHACTSNTVYSTLPAAGGGGSGKGRVGVGAALAH